MVETIIGTTNLQRIFHPYLSQIHIENHVNSQHIHKHQSLLMPSLTLIGVHAVALETPYNWDYWYACHCGNWISILEGSDLPKHDAAVTWRQSWCIIDGQQQQASSQTWHMEIKHFSLIDWVEQSQLILNEITSSIVAQISPKTIA